MRIEVAIALLAMTVQMAAAEAPTLKRFAVISSPEVQASGLDVAVPAAAASHDSLQWVERDSLNKVLDELVIERAFGADGVRERLRLGALLSADALVLLGHEKHLDKRVLRAVVTDARLGVRLRQQYFAADPIDVDSTSRAIAAALAELQAHYSGGIHKVAAVPPFVSRTLSHDYDHLSYGLANVLISALLAQPGVAVVELEDLESLRREWTIGGESRPPLASLAVRGEVRVSPAQGQRPTSIRLITDGRDANGAEIERTFPNPEAAAEFLRGDYAAKAFHSDAPVAEPMTVAQQAALLAAQADALVRAGRIYDALKLREAALLIAPSDWAQVRRVIRDALVLAPFRDFVNWGSEPDEDMERFIRLRLALWRRALALAELLLRSGASNPAEALWIKSRAEKAMAEFKRLGRFAGDRAPISAHIREITGEELRECDRVAERFFREMAPVVTAMEPSMPTDRHDVEALFRGERGDATLALDVRTPPPPAGVQYLLTYPECARLERPIGLSGAEVRHIAKCLAGPLQAECHVSYDLLSSFLQPTLHKQSPWSCSADDVRASVAALESVPGMAAWHGEFGHILLDFAERPTATDDEKQHLIARLTKWSESPPAACQDAQIGASGMVSKVRAALKIADGPTRFGQTPPTAKTPIEPVTPAMPARLADRRLPLTVIRADGTTLRFTPDSKGNADAQAWSAPTELVPADKFDILWNSRTVYLHRQPGKWEEVLSRSFEDDHRGISDCAFDSRHIWLMTCCEGFIVLDSTGKVAAQRKYDDQIPGAHLGACLAAVGPDRMIATGSFGRDRRAWVAKLTLEGAGIDVDLLHEAAAAASDAKSLEIGAADPKFAFVPESIHYVRSTGDGSAGRVFIARAVRGREDARDTNSCPMLEVNLDTREVRTADFGLRTNSVGYPFQIAFLDTKRCLVARTSTVRLHREGAGPDDGYLLLFGSSTDFPGLLGTADDVYVLGDPMARWNRRAERMEILGSTPPEIRMSYGAYGYSVHHGLVAWRGDGEYRQFLPGEAATLDLTERARLRAAVDTAPTNPTAQSQWVWHLLNEAAPEEARAAAAEWIRAQPRSLQARIAWLDCERKAKYGVAPLIDVGPQHVAEQPTTLVQWRVLRNPHQDTSAAREIGRAVMLDIPTQEPERSIAEYAFVEAAATLLFQGDHEALLTACNRWEQTLGAAVGDGPDRSYFAARAAARAALGDAAGAAADERQAADHDARGACWLRATKQPAASAPFSPTGRAWLQSLNAARQWWSSPAYAGD